jgi:hypothetical protein
MYFSTVCWIDHCHVIQWSIDSRLHCTETMVSLPCEPMIHW